jgi:uncharacterized membrane protein (UPF0127 family)
MKKTITYENKVLSSNIMIADNLWTRLVGLMFRQAPKDFDGLLIDPCRSIHTFFMKYALDIVFISRKGRVIKILRNLAPWRMTWIYFRSDIALEMPAGKLPADIKEGMMLEVKDV